MAHLTARQTAVLQAAMDRVIPPDDYPGAWEAGAGDYLLGQFDRDLAGKVEMYRAGLDALDAAEIAVGGVGFPELDAAAQDVLLARIEAGEVSAELARFFVLLVEHTMEGYYSDPGNGGNRDAVAWRMIGFEVRG
ncbi:MAG: gluconate 2-dehydrogenase subunit 3 family protein [Thermomicrobiales bacterium]